MVRRLARDFDPELAKADASRRIEDLQTKIGRGRGH